MRKTWIIYQTDFNLICITLWWQCRKKMFKKQWYQHNLKSFFDSKHKRKVISGLKKVSSLHRKIRLFFKSDKFLPLQLWMNIPLGFIVTLPRFRYCPSFCINWPHNGWLDGEAPSMLIIFKLPNKPELSSTLRKIHTEEIFFRGFRGILIKVSIEEEAPQKKTCCSSSKNKN